VGLDGLVAELAFLLALTRERGQRGLGEERVGGRSGTDTLTTMKGRPCSSFITVAVACIG
jgi:hypothetical protein